MQKTILSLVAYKCRICEKRKNVDLLTMEEEVEKKADLDKIINSYVNHIQSAQISKNSQRTIRIDKNLKIEDVDEYKKYSIYSKSGRLGQDFEVFTHSTNSNIQYSGDDNSAMYPQRTYCFISRKTGENVFVFFRYGSGGCKTAFQETLNQFLSKQKLVAHFDALMSNKMFDDGSKHYPETLTLVTQYTPKSSDSAENIKKQKKYKAIETTVYLASPNANNLRGWFGNLFTKQPSLDELKSITIKDNLGDNFSDAYVTLKVGKASRKIRYEDFTGSVAEYDITNKVEYYSDGKKFKEESLDKIVNEYAMSFFK